MAIEKVTGAPLETQVDLAADRVAFRRLARGDLSCNPDLADHLIQLTDASWRTCVAWSPSFADARVVALIASRRLFAIAYGMRSIAFRVPKKLRDVALRTGGERAPEFGASWARFELWRDHWPTPDLRFWIDRSFAAARFGRE